MSPVMAIAVKVHSCEIPVKTANYSNYMTHRISFPLLVGAVVGQKQTSR